MGHHRSADPPGYERPRGDLARKSTGTYHANGALENVYWTYSYGPIDDETAPKKQHRAACWSSAATTAQVVGARRLAKSEDRLRRFNADLERRVAERAGERNKTWQVTLGSPGRARAIRWLFRQQQSRLAGHLGLHAGGKCGTISSIFSTPMTSTAAAPLSTSAVAGQTLSRFEEINTITRTVAIDGCRGSPSRAAASLSRARDIAAERAAEAELANTREELRQSQRWKQSAS